MVIPEVGSFRHNVTWQTPDTGRDSLGQVNADDTYTTVGNRRASIITIEVDEAVIGKKPEGHATYMITQRYLAGLSARCIMVWDGRTFECMGPPDDLEQQHRFQQVRVCEISA